jgi:CBS domain-containing protein
MKIVKDLMVPLEEYTRVPEGASLHDAIEALANALFGPAADPARSRDRGVLVQAKDGRVLGKLSLWDVLRGLEPRYARPFDPLVMVEEYFTWTHSMFANLAEKARSIKAKDMLREHSRDELIDENAPLDLAVHQLVHGRLPSLVVMRGDSVVGVLRLGDVFKAVTEMINAADVQHEPV